MKFTIFKYLFMSLAIMAVLVPLVQPTPAEAVSFLEFSLKPECDPLLPPSSTETAGGGPCNLGAFTKWVADLLKIAFTLAVPIVIGLVTWGAFVIITSSGDPEKIKNGKGVIKAALIGLALIFGSTLIVTTITGILKK